MNKKLIATAMGLAMAGGMSLATADVKLYGQLDVSIDSIDIDGGVDDVNMGSNRSAVGFKGSEDLGNGLEAFFKVEYQVDIDDSGDVGPAYEDDTTEGGDGDGWKARDQYIGLKGESWGKLTFGSMSTAYKSPAAALDPFYRTRNQARNIGLQSSLHKGRGEEGQGRATNTVRYDSPSFGGVAFAGTYTLDNDETDGEDDDPYSLGITYNGGPIYAFASYITTDTEVAGNDENEAWQVGAKGTFGDAAVWAIYEKDEGLISGGPGSDGADIWGIGASYTIGNNLISLDYAEGDDTDLAGGGTLATEYATWRLGAKHNFSKRTMVYITHANIDVDAGGETDLTSLGMRHNF